MSAAGPRLEAGQRQRCIEVTEFGHLVGFGVTQSGGVARCPWHRDRCPGPAQVVGRVALSGGVVGLPMVGTVNEGVKPLEIQKLSRFEGILGSQGGFLCVSKTEG
jgi:hypothetical protein